MRGDLCPNPKSSPVTATFVLDRTLTFQNTALFLGTLFVVLVGVLPLIIFCRTLIGDDSLGSELLRRTLHSYNSASIARSLVFASVATAVQFSLALLLARLLFVVRLPHWVLLLLVLLPMSIPPLAASLMWKAILDYQSGPLNAVLEALHLGRFPWLSTFPVSYPPVLQGFSEFNWGQLSVLLTDSWLWIPFLTGAQLIALTRIPKRLFETARLEGASRGNIFWYVACPLSLPFLSVLVFFRFVDCYRSFDVSWAFFGEQSAVSLFSSRIYALGYLGRDYAGAGLLAIFGALAVLPVTLVLLLVIQRILVNVSDEESYS